MKSIGHKTIDRHSLGVLSYQGLASTNATMERINGAMAGVRSHLSNCIKVKVKVSPIVEFRTLGECPLEGHLSSAAGIVR